MPAAAQDEGGGAAPETATVRFVHAVPGVGEMGARMSGVALGSARFGEATDGASVPAGDSKLVVSMPRGALLGAPETLEAGESYTAIALYAETEGGAEVRFYPEAEPAGEVPDAASQGAPAAGPGGSDDGGSASWALVLGAAVAGTLLGGLGHRLIAGRAEHV